MKTAAKNFKIPLSTLKDHLKGKHTGSVGRPTVLDQETEKSVCNYIIKLSDWGFGLSTEDLKMLVRQLIAIT
jgi:hypothetical protein